MLAAAEEERFSRVKHDFRFPNRAIQFCLSSAEITTRDLDYVVFYEKPFLKFERIVATSMQMYPRSWKVFRESMATWLLDKLWIKETIANQVGVSKDKILFSEHHLSHAASAFFCSPFRDAAILTVDGVGEWATATQGIGHDNQIELLNEIRFPHSLGLLYSAFTAFLGFEVNEGEYKVMGMAPYGSPKYLDRVEQLIRVHKDGSFLLNMDYFSFHYSPQKTFTAKFIDLFGEPRNPATHFFTERSGYPSYFGSRPDNYRELCDKNQYFADIASSIQHVTEDVLLKMATALYERTGRDKLCMAGGVALNSVANTRILKETGFKEIFIQPSAGDGGGAVGAALYAYHCLLGRPRSFVMQHAYWGEEFSEAQILRFLDDNNIPFKCLDDDMLLDHVVDRLAAGEVIGWFQGRFEWGPRALGNRSILADPRREEMKDIVNTKIKFREPYRPFAPSILGEYAEEYFDLPNATQHYPSRYMLYVVPVKNEKRNRIPAVTHIDGTGRLQTVLKEFNPRYYRLIERFRQATGIPVLLNTSFNLKGEPIVNTPENAFRTFFKSEIDLLVLHNYIIKKKAL